MPELILTAATWALNNLTTLGREHILILSLDRHSLSAIYDVPHGAGLAVVLPAWMKWSKVENNEIFSTICRRNF